MWYALSCVSVCIGTDKIMTDVCEREKEREQADPGVRIEDCLED